VSLAFILCSSAHALPTEAEAEVSAALVKAADLGSDAKADFSSPDSNEFVLGVVLAEGRGKLLVLRKQSSGGYSLEAASSEFENNFGPRYYIEGVQASGARRFSIQVNAHASCGIQVETIRLAHASGAWRVAGYDKSEPDSKTCDVNLRSREYSANLLTHRVNVMEYRSGKVVKRESRTTKFAAPELQAFNFSMFQNEP
jgi:hypothetical protein